MAVSEEKQSTLDLVVVMPAFNEESSVESVLEEWIAVLDDSGVSYKLLLIDDGSCDQTVHVAATVAQRHPERITVVSKANEGHGRACLHGYRLALDFAAPWIMQIDSDGQCNARYFETFWQNRFAAPCIQGWRIHRDDGLIRMAGTVLLSAIVFLFKRTLCA